MLTLNVNFSITSRSWCLFNPYLYILLFSSILGNIEAKKSKAAKKSKGTENIKKKNKPNATASNEKSKEKTGETVKDSKLSPTDTFATDKLPEKNSNDKSEPASVDWLKLCHK